jgi:hypothetical protein
MMSLQEIARALGGEISNGQVVAPGPGHSSKDRPLSVRLTENGFVVYSHAGDPWDKCRDYVRSKIGLDSFRANGAAVQRSSPPKPRPEEDDVKRRVEYATGLWRNATPLPGTLGEKYFIKQRKLDIRQFDLHHCLRWNENARTIIAPMQHPLTDTPCGIHRTFLNEDGTKRERKMLGRQGVVKLTPDEEVILGIGIT